MSDRIIGVLVPIDPDRPMPPPGERPIGRAALALRAEGIVALFGDRLRDGRMDGLVATPKGWQRVGNQQPGALHDRYPSQRRAAAFAKIQDNRRGLGMGNALATTMLCRDKLESQQLLEGAGVRMPPVTCDYDCYTGFIEKYGAAFVKPRFGALGTNIRKVLPGVPLPRTLEGMVPGRSEPTILQAAIEPPAGFAGAAVRVLCQRTEAGGWLQRPAVLRRSALDPVVNVARGAEVLIAEDVLSDQSLAAIAEQCRRVCAAIGATPAGRWAVELGVDLVLDPHDRPWVIEINSRPRGRLEVLAALDPARFGATHVAACAQPLRRLATLCP